MKTAVHSYDEAVAQLYALGHELATSTQARRFELDHMRLLARALGDPQNSFKSVLIAGTNGKGSTAATLAEVLRAAGHRTALYTSPHLIRVNERLVVDGVQISDHDFARLHAQVEEAAQALVRDGKLPLHPSFFEMLTAMAFLYFAEQQVEVAVLEVGMGGRLDATNIVEPLVSIITDVDLDHQKYLGNTIAEIAREKAGIMRKGGAVILLPQHPEANQALGQAAMERNARAISAVPYMPPVTPAASPQAGTRNHYPLSVMGELITVDSPLCGRHQLRNIALAIAAAVELHGRGIRVTPHDIERGIAETRWPGRFQVLPRQAGRPEIVLDVAHNPAGAWALRAALAAYEERPITIVFGAMRDKAIGEIADILFPIAANLVLTHVENPRAASPEELIAAAPRVTQSAIAEPDVHRALARGLELAGTDGVLVVTGSVYLVGEALKNLQSRQS